MEEDVEEDNEDVAKVAEEDKLVPLMDPELGSNSGANASIAMKSDTWRLNVQTRIRSKRPTQSKMI